MSRFLFNNQNNGKLGLTNYHHPSFRNMRGFLLLPLISRNVDDSFLTYDLRQYLSKVFVNRFEMSPNVAWKLAEELKNLADNTSYEFFNAQDDNTKAFVYAKFRMRIGQIMDPYLDARYKKRRLSRTWLFKSLRRLSMFSYMSLIFSSFSMFNFGYNIYNNYANGLDYSNQMMFQSSLGLGISVLSFIGFSSLSTILQRRINRFRQKIKEYDRTLKEVKIKSNRKDGRAQTNQSVLSKHHFNIAKFFFDYSVPTQVLGIYGIFGDEMVILRNYILSYLKNSITSHEQYQKREEFLKSLLS